MLKAWILFLMLSKFKIDKVSKYADKKAGMQICLLLCANMHPRFLDTEKVSIYADFPLQG